MQRFERIVRPDAVTRRAVAEARAGVRFLPAVAAGAVSTGHEAVMLFRGNDKPRVGHGDLKRVGLSHGRFSL